MSTGKGGDEESGEMVYCVPPRTRVRSVIADALHAQAAAVLDAQV